MKHLSMSAPRAKRLLVITAVAAAGAAHAQSNVTVYGIVDAYGQYLDGASRDARIQSGGLSSSRLGFRGSEDLGQGYKGLFTLEMGFNVNDGSLGQGGLIFGRQAFVGIGSPWGEVTLGRQNGSLFNMAVGFFPFGYGAGPSATTVGGFAGGYEPFRGASGTAVPPAAGATGNGSPARINNSIRYASPKWHGLQGTAIVGLGEVAGNTADNRIYDLSLRYTADPFDAYLLYVSDKSSSALVPSEVATTALGGSYKLGAYKLYAGALSVDAKRPTNVDGRAYWLGADWTHGPHLVRATWLRSNPRTGGDSKTSAFGAGYQYSLSKRTQLYTSLTRFANGSSAGVDGLGRFNAAVPAGLTRAGDNDITEFVLGVSHSF